MIKVTLKDKSVLEFANPLSAIEIAKVISPALAKEACVAKIDGEVCDLRTVVDKDAAVEILTFDDADGKHESVAFVDECFKFFKESFKSTLLLWLFFSHIYCSSETIVDFMIAHLTKK